MRWRDCFPVKHWSGTYWAEKLIAHILTKLAVTGLKHDATANAERSIYSLRHTAICMRLVLSHGQVNIYSLAKNAGTSVNQIERFYAKRLPISKELMENLQSFGG